MKTDEQKECGLLAEVTEPTSYVVTGERKAKSCHVANKVTYEQLKVLIPNLFRYKFSAAGKHVLSYGKGQKVPSPDFSRERTIAVQISHFLYFVMSPAIITDAIH